MGQSTRLQISGYRFLLRRLEHALVRGDVRMLDDPLRTQSMSLVAGGVLAVIAVAVCAVVAFVAPRGVLGDAPIVMVRDSGALYVRIDDVMHPVPNLVSAQLVSGTASTPQLVSAAAVNTAPRGAAVGIPGAPDTIARPLGGEEYGWTVCEDSVSSTTTVILAAGGPSATPANLLVTPRGAGAAVTYLLFDGYRARVDLRNPAVVRALGLDDVAPRPVSPALLAAVPEVPEIAPPHIADAGNPGPTRLQGFPVGSVVRVPRADASDLYVVLAAGVQRVGQVAADLIRFTQPRGSREIVTVEPGVMGAVPILADLPVDAFPDRGGVAVDPVVCARWWWSTRSGSVGTAVFAADSLPIGHGETAVRLAQADADGPGIDGVVIPGGRSAYVRAAGVTGDGAHTGTRYLVTDAGVVFGVRDEDAAKRLGLSGVPVPAPWLLLARLPRGPELSVAAASVARDTVGPSS